LLNRSLHARVDQRPPGQQEITRGADGGTDPEAVLCGCRRHRPEPEENIQDVPIAIDVVSGEELKKAGFATMNDIDKIAPAVQLNQDQGTVKITVRGVGTTLERRSAGYFGSRQRRRRVHQSTQRPRRRAVRYGAVEVLRGPQGTLYGRNSTGGADQLHHA
jgi:outer membrane receptor for ferrienterochelin and colicin